MPPGTTVADRLAALVQDAPASTCRSASAPGTAARPARPTGRSLVVRSRRALRRLLWAPGELGLARAYVTGDIDVEGDLADGFRAGAGSWLAHGDPASAASSSAPASVAEACRSARPLGSARSARAPKPPAVRGEAARRLHSRGARPRGDLAPLRPVQRLLPAAARRDDGVLVARTSRDAGQSLADAQRAKLDLICRKLDLRAGDATARRRLRLGLADPARRRALRRHATGVTLSAQQRDHVPSGSPTAGSRTWSPSGCRTTASSPTTRRAPSTPSARSRWASTSARSSTRSTPRSCSVR